MKRASSNKWIRFLAGAFFATVTIESVYAAVGGDSDRDGYWGMFDDWSKKKERDKKNDWPRVVKEPLLMPSTPPKSKDQPKKDAPAKPGT